MVRAHAAAGGGHNWEWVATHAAAKATEAAAPEATEAASAATCRIARTPTHGYALAPLTYRLILGRRSLPHAALRLDYPVNLSCLRLLHDDPVGLKPMAPLGLR
jgi:hypothetical protein